MAVALRAGHRSRLAERTPWLFLANYFLPSLVLALAFVMMSRDGSLASQWLGTLRDSALDDRRARGPAFHAFCDAADARRPAPHAAGHDRDGADLRRRAAARPLRSPSRAILRRRMGLGCAMVFMESVKALDLALTLQPFGYSSLPLKIYAFSRYQNMDRAAVWVLLSQALMLLPWLLLWWRLERLDRPLRG